MLSISQIRPLVLHDDWFVRRAAVNSLAHSRTRDETVLPDILSRLDDEPSRRRDAMLSACSALPVSEAALMGIVGRLHSATKPSLRLQLAELIAGAPLAHLDTCRDEVRRCGSLGADASQRIQYRRQAASMSPETLWVKLQKHVRQSMDARYANEINYEYAGALVEALAMFEFPDTATVCRLLESAEPDNPDEGWLDIFLVDLAGSRRLREAVPILVEKLHIDADYLRERVAEALCKIGEPAAATLIARAFPRAAWDFRLYACDALRGLHCQETEDAALALLGEEESYDIRTLLCDVLCELFSQRGVEVVLEQIHKGYDRMLLSLEESLLPVIDALGCAVPQAELWRKQRLEDEEALHRRLDELDDMGVAQSSSTVDGNFIVTPPLSARQSAGRNDPCPCGSGLKFKKCCGGISSHSAPAASSLRRGA